MGKPTPVPNASAVFLLCTTLVLFDTYTVASVLKNPEYANIVRDVDIVELWSGVGTVVAAGAALGLQALPFDRDRVPGETEDTEDITSRVGFLRALGYIMRLKIGGLLHMAPVCSSFVFANSNNCKRHGPDFEGNMLYDAVCTGNLMATLSAFFMLLAHMREVYASAENPCGSTYFNFRPVHKVFDALGVIYQTTDGCRFSTVRKGKRFLKRFKFAATGPWICKVFRRCNCPGGLHEELMTTDANGGVSGTPNLKTSQAYPKALGAAIVAAWQLHRKSEEAAKQLCWTKPFAGPAPPRPSLSPPPTNQKPNWLEPFATPAKKGSGSASTTTPSPADSHRPARQPSADWTKPFLHKPPARLRAKPETVKLPKPAKPSPSAKSVKKTLPKTAKPSAKSAVSKRRESWQTVRLS